MAYVYDRLLQLDDVGRVFTFKSATYISGGQLVGLVSGTDVITSGATPYAGWTFDKVLVSPGSIATTNYIGIALTSAGSLLPVAVAMEGIYALQAGATAVVGGNIVGIAAAGSSHIIPWNQSGTTITNTPVGKALSNATANTGFALVKLI
jgi:hypothetical protein